MNVLIAASEVTGFAKTGGLADVAGALPLALARRGHACAVVLPLYRCARTAQVAPEPLDLTLEVPIGARQVRGRVWRSRLGAQGEVPVYLIEQADYFDRDDARQGRSLYQFTLPSGQKADYPDNCERFVFFCRAALEAARLLDLRPDVLHANDWQTGLMPVYLREIYHRHHGFERTGALLTVHNIAYQGLFWQWDMALTGLDWRLFNPRQLEFYGQLNFLKAGLVFADLINTVSPTYAREIQTPYFGCGLQGLLSERRNSLYGIVNGVDYDVWDPAHDRYLEQQYDVESVVAGKARCKAALCKQFSLPERPGTPLFGMVARLVEQKGVDLLLKAAESFLQQDVQLVLLGEGDPHYHRLLTALRDRFSGQVGLKLGFDEGMAHQIEAGSDLFLMPSLFEPSGLNQLYSMRYGAVPLVRATGGLADTVVDSTPEALHAQAATGFTFITPSHEALLAAIARALDLYRRQGEPWLQIVRTGMRQDWSWDRSAAEYERLYQQLSKPK